MVLQELSSSLPPPTDFTWPGSFSLVDFLLLSFRPINVSSTEAEESAHVRPSPCVRHVCVHAACERVLLCLSQLMSDVRWSGALSDV